MHNWMAKSKTTLQRVKDHSGVKKKEGTDKLAAERAQREEDQTDIHLRFPVTP